MHLHVPDAEGSVPVQMQPRVVWGPGAVFHSLWPCLAAFSVMVELK